MDFLWRWREKKSNFVRTWRSPNTYPQFYCEHATISWLFRQCSHYFSNKLKFAKVSVNCRRKLIAMPSWKSLKFFPYPLHRPIDWHSEHSNCCIAWKFFLLLSSVDYPIVCPKKKLEWLVRKLQKCAENFRKINFSDRSMLKIFNRLLECDDIM